MKPDLYTKSVLTVIAGSLLWLCVQNGTSPKVVSAQKLDASPQKITIVDQHGNSLGAYGDSIPVRIVGTLPK